MTPSGPQDCFFFEYQKDSDLPQNQEQISNWLKLVVKQEGRQISWVKYIFCSDPYLRDLNKNHLDHDYDTDVLSFDLSAPNEALEGEIYISLDRVKENATSFEVSMENELNRVMLHGLLHFCGYQDDSDENRAEMRSKENFYLEKLSS